MGMFDTIIDYKLKCPYCGSNSKIDIQTKGLSNLCMEYFVGDEYTNDFQKTGLVEIRYIATCSTTLCKITRCMIQYLEDRQLENRCRHFTGTYLVDCKKDKFIIERILSIIPEVPIVQFKNYKDLKAQFLNCLKHDKKTSEYIRNIQRKMGGIGIELGLLYV